MTRFMSLLARSRRVLVLVVVAALAFGLVASLRNANHMTIHAQFASVEGLNVNDAVKVLGVPVGKVTGIEDQADGALVTMKVRAGLPIPVDAHALIVAPSLVSGRFVQLAPAFTNGARLQDGATIGADRTAEPLSFDDVKRQLTDLATTLGPSRGGRGALATTIIALNRGLKRGNAHRLRQALSHLRGAAMALSDGRSDLFTTISNLDSFTRNLALNDAAVRGFTVKLDAVGTTLATNRSALRGAIHDLADVLSLTKNYLNRHRARIVKTAGDLNLLAAALADRSNELAGVLHVAPHALIDLSNTIENQAITAQVTTTNFDDVAQLLCGALLGAGGTSQQCRDALGPLTKLLGLAPGTPR